MPLLRRVLPPPPFEEDTSPSLLLMWWPIPLRYQSVSKKLQSPFYHAHPLQCIRHRLKSSGFWHQSCAHRFKNNGHQYPFTCLQPKNSWQHLENSWQQLENTCSQPKNNCHELQNSCFQLENSWQNLFVVGLELKNSAQKDKNSGNWVGVLGKSGDFGGGVWRQIQKKWIFFAGHSKDKFAFWVGVKWRGRPCMENRWFILGLFLCPAFLAAQRRRSFQAQTRGKVWGESLSLVKALRLFFLTRYYASIHYVTIWERWAFY